MNIDEDYKSNWIKAEYETMGWDRNKSDCKIYYCEKCGLMHSYLFIKQCPKERL